MTLRPRLRPRRRGGRHHPAPHVDGEARRAAHRRLPGRGARAAAPPSRRSSTCSGTASCPTPPQLAALRAEPRRRARAAARRPWRCCAPRPRPARRRWTRCAWRARASLARLAAARRRTATPRRPQPTPRRSRRCAGRRLPDDRRRLLAAAAAARSRSAAARPRATPPTTSSCSTGEEPAPERARALETYLNTVVDHGLNASTFAARVIISTGSDLVSAIVGAVGALKGPLHGGAPGPALDMVFEIGTAERAEPVLRAKLARGERLMGFGHRVYSVRDPRADVLGAAAERFYRERRRPRRSTPWPAHVEATAAAPAARAQARPPAGDQRRVLHRAAAARPRPAHRPLHAHLRDRPRRRLDGALPRAAARGPAHPPAGRIRGPARPALAGGPSAESAPPLGRHRALGPVDRRGCGIG